MTKKEAFEHLKNSKVLLRTEDEQVKLQEFLFKIGYKWQTMEKSEIMKLYSDVCVFFIDSNGCISHCGYDDYVDKAFCDTHAFESLSLEYILGLEIDVEEVKWKDVFTGVRDTLGDKQIMVISKDNVMIIDL
jgi:hypothetical protein